MANELFDSLPSHWKTATLGEACTQGGGNVQTGPFGSQLHASDYVPVGIPFVMPQNIGDNRILTDGVARITPSDVERLSRYILRKGDIVYSRRGDVERRALVRNEEDGWMCGSGCLRVRFGREIVDPLYASYYLGHPNVRSWIVRHAVGATMPNLNTSILSNLPFVIPPLDEQKAIAHILGTLDDKIELNQQTNQTLEAIARALFKSWFIDFDPVRAKLDGRQPAGMDAETAALFPAEFEDSALGKIPKDWKVQIIGDVIEFAYGKPLKQPDRQHGIVPVYGSNGQIGWHNKSLVKAPGIVIGRKGNPGTVVWTPIDFYPIDTTFYAIPISSTKSLHYLFHALCLQDLPSLAADSAVPGLNRNLAYMNKLLIPSEECLEAFDSIVNGISAKVHITNQEAITLTSIRDALLPKLLSGEIRVQDAETVVEAVT